MKKITKNLLPILGIVGLIFMTSCGKDEGVVATAPSISISASVDGSAIASGDNVEVGSSVAFAVTITAPGGVNGLTVNGTSYSRSELGAEAGDTQVIVTNISSGILAETSIGLTAKYDFVAVDDLGQESEVETFTFVVVALPSPVAKAYGTTLLTPPAGDGTTDTFFGIGNGTLYSHNDVTGTAEPVSANIDLGYYYGATDMASLSAPAAYPSSVFDISAWGTKKDTKLEVTTLDSEDFIGMSTVADVNAKLEAITFETTGGNIETNLTAGKILAFKTADTEAISGFIYVEAITGTTGNNDSITLQFVLNKAAE
jgi:hypothetical protein